MTWEDFHAARQQLAEEFVGVNQRAKDRSEHAQIEQTRDLIRKYAPPPPKAATPAVIPPKPITDEIIG